MNQNRFFIIIITIVLSTLIAYSSIGKRVASAASSSNPVLDHIGIAVTDINFAVETYQKLGFTPVPIIDNSAFGTKNVFLSMDTGSVEIVQPVNEESPVAKFLANNGPGLHHIAFSVRDIQTELERLKGADVTLVNSEPMKYPDGSLVAFVHPKSTAGVIIQLIQHPK